MNYEKHYNQLISKAKNRILEGYSERHHIIPKCMGGSNNRDNIVRLTPEEHYVAHQLLLKIYPDNHKLAFAANMLSVGRNNKQYGWIKKRFAEACRKEKLGKPAWNKGIKTGPNPKISASRKGQKTWNRGLHNPNGATNGKRGAKKLSETAKGRKRVWISDTKWTWTKRTEK